jgi:hypothetical protein
MSSPEQACRLCRCPQVGRDVGQMPQLAICCRAPPPITAARVRTLRNPHNLQDQLRPLAAKLASTISASLTNLFKSEEQEQPFSPPDVLPSDVEDEYDTMYNPGLGPTKSLHLYEEAKQKLGEYAEKFDRKVRKVSYVPNARVPATEQGLSANLHMYS